MHLLRITFHLSLTNIQGYFRDNLHTRLENFLSVNPYKFVRLEKPDVPPCPAL